MSTAHERSLIVMNELLFIESLTSNVSLSNSIEKQVSSCVVICAKIISIQRRMSLSTIEWNGKSYKCNIFNLGNESFDIMNEISCSRASLLIIALVPNEQDTWMFSSRREKNCIFLKLTLSMSHCDNASIWISRYVTFGSSRNQLSKAMLNRLSIKISSYPHWTDKKTE